METKIFKINSPEDENIKAVGEILREGGLAAIPTETELAAEEKQLIEDYKKQYMSQNGVTESQALSQANDSVAALGSTYIYEQVMYRKIDDVLVTQVKTKEIPSEKIYVFDAQVK